MILVINAENVQIVFRVFFSIIFVKHAKVMSKPSLAKQFIQRSHEYGLNEIEILTCKLKIHR